MFFTLMREVFFYEPDAFPLGPAGGYLPDFYLPRLRAFFEVKGAFEWSVFKLFLFAAAITPEYGMYIALGDLPSERQLRSIGWWDLSTETGVLHVGCRPWDELFPPESPRIRAAVQAARSARFERGRWPAA